MKNLYCLLLTVCVTFFASAQKVFFIYLQTDNYSPFYVKMTDKIYSSSTSGYLILSGLRDSSYTFSLGFPSSQSESKFAVTLGGKDRGFLIKNFQTGPGLFDLQNLNIINAQKDESEKNISYQKRNDDFSFLLSKAANDTSLLYAVVRIKEDVAVQNEQPKSEEPKKADEPAVVKDTASAKMVQNDVAVEKQQDVATADSGLNVTKKNGAEISSVKGDSEKDTIAFVGQKEQPKQNIIASSTNGQQDTLTKKTDEPVTLTTKTEEITFKRSKILKHSESSTSEGFGLVFYDKYEGGEDTIRLLIPNPPVALKQNDQDSSEREKDFIHVDG